MFYSLVLPAYETAPVAQSLIPPLEAFPSSLQDVLTHLPPRRRLALSDIRLNHILLIQSITFSPPESVPLLQPTDTANFDYGTEPVSMLVQGTINTTATNQELLYNIHPLALHLGHQKVGLEYTIHPLLAVINEDRLHHHRLKIPGPAAQTGYQQLPLVVAYLYAMAQRWFTAVEGEEGGDEEVRVWVVATRVEQTAEVFWADVKREDLAGLCLRVKRSGRWDGLGQVREKGDAFACLVRGIWESVWRRATPAENVRRWGKLPVREKRRREEHRPSVRKRTRKSEAHN